ncbi:hypothetical protein HPB49_015220 [Dermacentor silvarum]|uniref:Uncharacterized protein n=1 Tax=Dermacentor silvarum TaxID=543639 RepID=A0ACB8CRY8_DERSI|nr:hypothetical protein HPB49_015220 [Dermacentor silvarum]
MINTFQLSPVKGTHALKNWTHRPHPAPEAVPDPEGDPDPGDAPYPGGAPDLEDGQRPEGRESASIPEAALGLTAAPWSSFRPKGNQTGAVPGSAGATIWADIIRGRQAEVRSGASSEHATGSAHKIAQLERENANMREVIKKLTSEIAEIKHARGTRPPPASATLETPQPMEVPIAEGEHDEARPSKKRAVVYEQDSLPGRVKSEIREMFSALSDSVRQLAEKVSQIQSEMAFQAQSLVGIPKATGGYRLCADLTKLNQVLLLEEHLMPTVEQVLGLLGPATVFCKLDARAVFHQKPPGPASAHAKDSSAPQSVQSSHDFHDSGGTPAKPVPSWSPQRWYTRFGRPCAWNVKELGNKGGIQDEVGTAVVQVVQCLTDTLILCEAGEPVTCLLSTLLESASSGIVEGLACALLELVTGAAASANIALKLALGALTTTIEASIQCELPTLSLSLVWSFLLQSKRVAVDPC